MSSPGSVNLWIAQLKAGAPDVAQSPGPNYVRRLAVRARRRLAGYAGESPMGRT
jgi:hypothetical protein